MLLLFLGRLFPEWRFARDVNGVWRAEGRVLISASSADVLLGVLARWEPGAGERIRRMFDPPAPGPDS
ncbi:hypothetical protein [Actinomadura verrucosospora]|uniref:hypothetical protein n=1 Tax=Actinomadura verrucosospora TaxID=46165 RepID=UPI001564A75B|nr:hypothetical protein [Actinomadura verrucosospora]